MGYISWVVLGLIAGALAKFIMPGKDPGGIILTIVIGIAGAFIGGFLGSYLGFAPAEGLGIRSIGVATGGAIVLLIAYRLILGRS